MVDFRSLGVVAVQQHPNDREDHLVPEATSSPDLAPDRIFARGELRGKLDKAMKTLPERYQQVVKPVLRPRYDDERNRRRAGSE